MTIAAIVLSFVATAVSMYSIAFYRGYARGKDDANKRLTTRTP